jgi:hypothetical protein
VAEPAAELLRLEVAAVEEVLAAELPAVAKCLKCSQLSKLDQ